MANKPDCKKCGANEWFHMPDSLAWACKKCGTVIVETGEGWIEGASIQEWLRDVYGEKKE